MKKAFIFMVIVILIVFLTAQTGVFPALNFMKLIKQNGALDDNKDFSFAVSGNVKYKVRVEGNYFYFYDKGVWKKEFIRGVNIGAGAPGLFPGDLSISYDDYYRWFEYISEMNCNSIRVYTTLRPQFYNALYDFNQKSDKPLYLFQGIWLNESDINSLSDAYAQNNKILNDFIKDAKTIVDVIHGNATLPARAGYASGVYTADVSMYLAGWIAGTEWDPKFVKTTNDMNSHLNKFDGEYLYTISATPFEAFLCQVGNELIKYETEKYRFQAPLAFTNWVTTDPLIHPNEPHPDEDLMTVNVENIKARDAFSPGEFAVYHVYPYYPDSFNYQKDYINYVDPEGKVNPYRAYMKDLKMAHTMPILIGEFGIPTSRGMGHESIMGYNQGMVDETDQGKMILDMMKSIYEENYAGGLSFTWQDEWFKRTWNNERFDIPDKRPFWSNIQTNEQNFGILAFDPGKEKSVSYIDGDISEWKDISPAVTTKDASLYINSDERYLYFMLKLGADFDFEKDTLLIALDTIDSQGNLTMTGKNVSFNKGADFVIEINGKDNTRIMVDSYYDSFYFLYGEQYKMLTEIPDIRKKNTGRFNKMMMCFGYEMTVLPENTVIPFKSFETGKLSFGISNPNSDEYKSLADFYYKDGNLEIRIPWQLINVMDPSDRKIMDDLYLMQSIVPTDLQFVNVGFGKLNDALSAQIDLDGKYTWKKWVMPTYHERLKPSYYVLRDGYAKLN